MLAELPGGSLSTQMQPELEILLICTNIQVREENSIRLKTLLPEKNIDWAALVELAIQHKVMPMLYSNLNTLAPEVVPQPILARLRAEFQQNTRRSLRLSGELVRLLNVFEAQGISLIPFKGPVLAASAYGNLLLRQFSDLDVLVHSQDLERAKAIFLSEGYQMKIERIAVTPEQKKAFIESSQIYQFVREDAYPFLHPEKETLVELHWGIMPRYFAFNLDDSHLWENLESVMIAGKAVPNLSPENTVLAIVGHGTKECWTELARICDLAAYLYSHPQLNWAKLIQTAQNKGSQRILFLGLLLTHHLFNSMIPEQILQKIQADQQVIVLEKEVYNQLLYKRDRALKDGSKTRFHLQVRERLKDKIWYFLQIATTPTTTDWLLLPLAKFPAFIYYLLRPIRLIFDQGLKIKKLQF